MKIRKHISLLLMLFATLTLFSGCNFQMTMLPQTTKATTGAPSTHMDTTEATQVSEATQTTETTEATQPEQRGSWSASTVARAIFEEHKEVINGVYATCGNYYYTDYAFINHRITFYLMCEAPLPSDATITIDTESEYKVSIVNVTPDSIDFDVYPLDLWKYVEYGFDYGVYNKLKYDSNAANLEYKRHWKDEDEKLVKKLLEELQRAQKVLREYESSKLPTVYYNELLELYESQNSSDLENLGFYYYKVTLTIAANGYQVISDVELVAGDMSRTITVGRVFLEEGKEQKSEGSGAESMSLSEASEIPDYQFISANLKVKYFNTGTWSPYGFYSNFWICANENITLTDIVARDRSVQATHAEMTIIGKENNIQLSWEPGTEIFIRKGERVAINVYYDSPYMHQAECCIKDLLMIKYTGANGDGYVGNSISFLRERPAMEVYLWVFKNVDMQSYYEDVYEYAPAFFDIAKSNNSLGIV